jgi:hypothetical protein
VDGVETPHLPEDARVQPYLPFKHAPTAPSPACTHALRLLHLAERQLCELAGPDRRVQNQVMRAHEADLARAERRGPAGYAGVVADLYGPHGRVFGRDAAPRTESARAAPASLEEELLGALDSEMAAMLSAQTEVVRPCAGERTCVMFMLVKTCLKATLEHVRASRLDRYDLQQLQLDAAWLLRRVGCLLPGSEPDADVTKLTEELLAIAASRFSPALDAVVQETQERLKQGLRLQRDPGAYRAPAPDTPLPTAAAALLINLPPHMLAPAPSAAATTAASVMWTAQQCSDACDDGPSIDFYSLYQQ